MPVSLSLSPGWDGESNNSTNTSSFLLLTCPDLAGSE